MDQNTRNTEFIELYKLHAEFADRVSQRRAGANRLYTGLLTGLMVAASGVLNLAPFTGPANEIFFWGLGFLGVILSVSWYIVIRSYRQLNRGKFTALLELEKRLAYPFFTKEWEFLKNGPDYRKYWELTVVETALPVVFFLASLLFIVLYWVI